MNLLDIISSLGGAVSHIALELQAETVIQILAEIVSINALTVHGSGRSVRYELNW